MRAVEAQREATKQVEQPLPVEELRAFTEVFSRIKADYVEPVDDKKLLRDAIQGMLSGLDPHSSYLDPDGVKDLRVGTEGKFGGLGIEVTMEDGLVKVISPIEDTPAARAGIKPGDLIVRLDEKPVKGMTLNEAVKIMRGRPGTDIVLTVMREGQPKPLKFTVTRAEISMQSIKQRVLEDGYAYVRITQFQANTGDALKDALNKLKLQNKGNLKGLVLDLRNNPGGVLNAAVTVSDAFLTSGLIVYTEGRVSDAEMRYSATPPDLINGAPIVVLVNGGSASASEIVAGALQDHKRAVIMGTKTFGKGSVQTILPMSGGAALKITTARYFTPNGRSIQATGIVPDVVTEEAKITKREKSVDDMIKEADLPGHIENKSKEKPGAKKDSPSVKLEAGSSEDYQLQEALNLLKGISIFRAQAR
ncbi:MAG: S41 family peptidase [Gammaproteobacteria bacterium]|nr:S41 family peptidase [Gammaproteobacteria bacterium]